MAPRKKKNAPDFVRAFESLDDAITCAMEGPNNVSDRASRRKGKAFAEWTGTATFGDAVQLAREGWSEIRPDIDRIVSGIRDEVTQITRKRIVTRRSVAGGAVNVGRMMSGDPRCMKRIRFEPTPATGRVVKIVVNAAASSAVSPEQIRKRGAAIVALVEAIHLSGASTEITVAQRVVGRTSTNRGYQVRIKVKRAEDRLDINTLMFAVAHPSMLRRIVFGVEERESGEIREEFGLMPGGGYGVPAKLADTDMSEFGIVVDMPNGYRNEQINQEPVEWIRGTLTGLSLVKVDAV